MAFSNAHKCLGMVLIVLAVLISSRCDAMAYYEGTFLDSARGSSAQGVNCSGTECPEEMPCEGDCA